MGLTMEFLHNFGEASGLHCNLQKSCVVPIRCEPSNLEMVSSTLPRTPTSFPQLFGVTGLEQTIQ